jgi:enoyl-CoA hydratase
VAEYVNVQERDGIALVTIDRPPANAMDGDLLEQGRAVLDDLGPREPGAVVVTGREAFFSGGADLKMVPTLDEAGQRRMVTGINRLFAGWYSFPRPVVCAVNGHAIAGGLILALCGDHRVVGSEGKFGLTEVRVGIPYPAAAMAVVRAELSPPAARALALRAELHDAAGAMALGLFDEQVAQDAVLDRALEVAGEMAALPSAVYEMAKRQVRGDVIDAVNRIAAGEDDLLAGPWVGEDIGSTAGSVLRD